MNSELKWEVECFPWGKDGLKELNENCLLIIISRPKCPLESTEFEMIVDISSSTRIRIRDNEWYLNLGETQIEVIIEVRKVDKFLCAYLSLDFSVHLPFCFHGVILYSVASWHSPTPPRLVRNVSHQIWPECKVFLASFWIHHCSLQWWKLTLGGGGRATNSHQPSCLPYYKSYLIYSLNHEYLYIKPYLCYCI